MSSPSRAARRHPDRHSSPLPKIAIAWMHPGDTAGAFTNLMFDIASHDGANGHLIEGRSIRLESSPRLAQSRCEMVREFLKMGPEVKYLAMFDADMSGTGDCVYRMLRTAMEFDAGIVGGLCFVGGRGTKGMYPTIYALSSDPERAKNLSVDRYSHYPMGGVVQCHATGAAALLIRRDVVEKMGQQYARLASGAVNPTPWFAEGTHANQEYGEDVTFCIRAALLGFKIVVDTRIQFGHMKTYELNEELYRLHLQLTGQLDLKSTDDSPEDEGFFNLTDMPGGRIEVEVTEPEPEPEEDEPDLLMHAFVANGIAAAQGR